MDAQIPNASQSGRMHRVLAMNLGRPAYTDGRVLLLRTRSDLVLDQISETAVVLRRSRDGALFTIGLQELTVVVLREGMSGAESGEAIPPSGDTPSDLRIVSDRPFTDVRAEISAEGPYLWRSAFTEELSIQILVAGMRMAFFKDEQGLAAAENLVALAGRILEQEPGVEDPSFFQMYGDALGRLKRYEETLGPYERCLQCARRRGGVGEEAQRLLHRRLGITLSTKGVEDDDRALKIRGLQHLEAAKLAADDGAVIRLRDHLRSKLAT